MGQEMTKPERKEFDRGSRAHYFTEDDTPAVTENKFPFAFKGRHFTFETGPGMFSKGRVDTGSRILLQEFCKNEQPAACARFLDLGCGYGLIGIVLAGMFENINVDFIEKNTKAAKFAEKNATNNGIGNAKVYAIDFTDEIQRRQAISRDLYDYILFNPPVKAGKQAMSAMIEAALSCLKVGGTLYLVIRTSLGAKSWQAIFEKREDIALEVFRESGYRVFKLTLR
ncbi:MAG: class I SAM-dependent methyltransferase [Candidatus Sigynarchaeota archaeon]